MIKALIIILLIGGVSLYNSDLASESSFVSILLPIVSVLSLIALALWIVVLFHKRGINQKTRPDGGGTGFFDDGPGGGE